MRSKTMIVFVLALVLSISLMAGSSMAVDFQGERYIEEGGYHAIPFTTEDAGIYRFTIDSVNGESVAVLIMDTVNFQRYSNNLTFEYEDYTIAVTEERRVALMAGNFYFIIDNSNRIAPTPEGGVQVEYSMQEEFPFSEFFENIVIISVISVIIIVIVIIFLVYFLRKDERRRQRAFQTSMTAGQMKYCMHCGQQMPAEASLCPHCGGRN